MPSWWMIPTVFLPIAGGMGARLIPFSRRLKQIFLLAVITATSVLTALQIFRGDGNSAVLFSVMDDLTLVFRLDGAGKIFAGLLALLWPPAMLYTYLYMQGRNAEGFFCFYTMSYGVALAIAFAGNLFTLYAFYECLTMVTLPLVAFNKDRAARKAGQTYVNFSITGAAMAFVGMLFLSHYDTPAGFSPGGVLDMARVAGHEEMLRWVFLLAFIGFGTKAAVFPMYAWLPAVSVAPTPVTALLHAVAVRGDPHDPLFLRCGVPGGFRSAGHCRVPELFHDSVCRRHGHAAGKPEKAPGFFYGFQSFLYAARRSADDALRTGARG